MENQLPVETAKLSLVGKHSHAIDFNLLQDENAPQSVQEVAERLPAILQTTLEVDHVVELFHSEISKILSYDSLHYQHKSSHSEINMGSRSHHKCHYRLEMNGAWLGELTLTRNKKFTDADTQVVEDLLCKLVYPLRNCLLYRESQAAALQDKLTGLNNRGAFDNSLKREIDLAQRQHSPMSLVMLDIDFFKAVNDNYGHAGGDLALKKLAASLIETMRASDIAFRYGGEEFALILSNTDSQAAELVAERIRVAISKLSCNDGSHSFSFTVSLGVAQLNHGEDESSLFNRADSALYKAKKAGRNQTTISA